MQSPPGGFAQSLGGNLQPRSQPNQSAISGSFFGTKYWKCAESDDGNPKKSMILHRMVPSDSAKSVLIDLSLPPLQNSAFWRPFRTQEVRPAAALHAPSTAHSRLTHSARIGVGHAPRASRGDDDYC